MPASTDSGRLLQISHNTILGHEDKTFPGAFIASASFPWGQSQGDDDLGGYHLVWTRDMVQSASSLLYCGHVQTAQRALLYLACTQKVDGSFAQNFWIYGTPYRQRHSARRSGLSDRAGLASLEEEWAGHVRIFPFVERASGFLMRSAPVTQQERWEENAGYSPSDACDRDRRIGLRGRHCAGSRRAELARSPRRTCRLAPGPLEDRTVTDQGVLLPEVKRHYMRIRPPECGDPDEDGTAAGRSSGSTTSRQARRTNLRRGRSSMPASLSWSGTACGAPTIR